MNRINRRDVLRLSVRAAAGALVLDVPSWTWAAEEPYPNRPVTLIVPQPPGGDADAVCRLLQSRMQEELGKPLIIDNRSGAAGNIGAAFGAKAQPDGYTVTFVNQGIVAFNPTLYANPGFSLSALDPVSWMTTTDLVICATPALGVTNLREFIALARTSPGKYTYGTAGNGSANHIAAKMLEAMARIELNHVPYKGGAPAIVDALGGQIDTVVAFPLAALPHVRSGKLLALAVTGAARARALPNVPTVAESGVTGYEFWSWFGLMVPKGTPANAIAKINAAVAVALKVPGTADRLRQGLTEPVGAGPTEFAALIVKETRRWPPLIKQYDIRPD